MSFFKKFLTLESFSLTSVLFLVTPLINLAIPFFPISPVPSVKSLNHSFNIFINLGFISLLIINFSFSITFLLKMIFSFGFKFEFKLSSNFIINSYKESLLLLSSILSFSIKLFFFICFKYLSEKEKVKVSGGKLYILNIRNFNSLIVVFPNNKYFLISSSIFLFIFSFNTKGRWIKQFLSKDKCDLGLNKQFFSDSFIIKFNKIIHLLIISGVELSSFIIVLNFSSNFSKFLFLYILKIILIAVERTFFPSILKIIFHNLSSPSRLSISSTSISSYTISLSLSVLVSFTFILSLFISKNKAINNFICSIVISVWFFFDNNSNSSFRIFSFLLIESSLIFLLSVI